mmetsp:Transcript_63706/g.153846  ORF Transcript_63706/g.153846 Transcript_63706/m.153846 type:complete len:101 (+) Transcript_63706:2-304(+)
MAQSILLPLTAISIMSGGGASSPIGRQSSGGKVTGGWAGGGRLGGSGSSNGRPNDCCWPSDWGWCSAGGWAGGPVGNAASVCWKEDDILALADMPAYCWL